MDLCLVVYYSRRRSTSEAFARTLILDPAPPATELNIGSKRGPAEHERTECFLPQVPQSVFRCVHSNFPKFRPLCPGLRRWRVALPNRTQRSLSLRLRQEIQTVLRETRPVMIGEKKASSEKRSFCRTGCFQARPRWRVGEIEKPPACMQKPRSKNWPNGRCARGKPELARAMAPAIENRKAFRSELAARWILAAIDCEVCQAVRNYIRGRASNASRRWPRRSDC